MLTEEDKWKGDLTFFSLLLGGFVSGSVGGGVGSGGSGGGLSQFDPWQIGQPTNMAQIRDLQVVSDVLLLLRVNCSS